MATTAQSPQAGGPLGPPEQNPWKDLTNWKPLDTLVDESLVSMTEHGHGLNGLHNYSGTMKFAHPALMGPPGRLQGGLHCVARIFPILRRIERHEHNRTFPCRIYVRLEKGLPLNEEVPFTASYHQTDRGHWWMTSRFSGTDKLDAGAWSVADTSLLHPEKWESWRERFQKVSADPGRRIQKVMTTEYESSGDLFWCRITPEQMQTPAAMLRVFETGDGQYSAAFICYYLDVIGALAKATEGFHPQFTTQVSLEIAQERIPATEPLIVIADKSTRQPARHSRAKPLEMGGELHGTTLIQTLLASGDFKRIYAHGWVAAHPMDTRRILKK